jgi:Arc/MetJ-type ribon-helix-helix transcriptional regulator
MLVQIKVQIGKESYDFIKKAQKELKYKSLSEYVRDAVNAKIREDRRKIREKRMASAMEMLGEAPVSNLFESIEGDDFEER